MIYSEIKTVIQTIYSQYIGSGNIIESDSGSPTALALLLDLVNNRVLSYPYEWPFLKITGTLTLTGATSYDLTTLFPDLKSVYQLYGLNDYEEYDYLSNKDANISSNNRGYTIKGKTLYFSGNAPTSGTFNIQYKSKYMVETSAGVRQQYFLNDDDVSVLDSDDVNVLIFGLGQFVNWQIDNKDNTRRQEVSGWFKEAWSNLLLHNEQTNQLGSLFS